MTMLSELVLRDLEWGRVRWAPPAFTLRFDDATVAELEFPKLFTVKAVGRTENVELEFRPLRVFRPSYEVRAAGGDAVGIFRPRSFFGGGELRCPGGASFLWLRSRLFHEWTFHDRHGSPLVRVRRRFGPRPPGGGCLVEPAAASLPELPLLVLLGLFLTVLRAGATRYGGG